MILTGLRMTSWLCYKGNHEIALEPVIYAVVAERDGDPRKSNAQGKSALLRAIRFVLTGDHDSGTEDDWISEGQPEGGVDAEFTDGTFASRTRKRGASTKLKVITPDGDGERELLDDEAQDFLDRLVGSPGEQLATWWVEQKKCDRFITADPAVITRDVAEWTGIEPLREATAAVAMKLDALVRQHDTAAVVLAQAEAGLRAMEPEELLRELLAKLRAEEATLLTTLDSDKKAQATVERLARQRHDAEEYDRLAARLAAVEAHAKPYVGTALTMLPELLGSYARAKTRNDEADRAVREKNMLSRGLFNGVCPVGGIQCPAKDQLNADGEKSRELLALAKTTQSKARTDLEAVRLEVQTLETAKQALDDFATNKANLEEQMRRLRPAWEAHRAEKTIPEYTHDSARLLTTVRASIADAERKLVVRDQYDKSIGAQRGVMMALQPELTTHREALLILGPGGAQRRVAEGMLETVEDGANASLQTSGVDLRAAFSWQREGKALADNCEQCGAPFPSSRKVKNCTVCGSARGMKIERKLRIQVKPKSGGNDDLAGMAIRLAAFAWLKAKRGTPWSVACLDEPFAALDAHNRHGVARHLVALLGSRYGVEQAFVTAHDASLLGGLPHRILITGSDAGSTVRVVG